MSAANNVTIRDFLLYVNRDLNKIYFYTSLVSVIFVTVVIISYILFPKLRRHPINLLFHRTILDLIICLCHIVQFTFVNAHGDPTRNGSSIKEKCRPICFIYQVALFGSNSWYFVLSIDLLLAVRNPFSCHSDYLKFYYGFVYATSIVTGIILVSGQYGLTVFNYCWVQDGLVTEPYPDSRMITSLTSEFQTASGWVWGIYYGPHLVLCIISVLVVFYTTTALNRGLPASGETRRRVVKFGFYYVVAFAVEWALRLALYLVQDRYLLPKSLRNPVDFRDQLHRVAVTYAVLEGLRGVVDFALWFGTGSLTLQEIRARGRSILSSLKRGQGTHDLSGKTLKAPLLDSSHDVEVSSVLRHDMITCTSWGIVDSAPVSMRPANLSVPGFENHLRRNAGIQSERELAQVSGDAAEQHPSRGLNELQNRLDNFEVQRSELALWLKSADTVRTRRIHCPTALQSTKFDFRDFAPDIFSCIRSLRGVDPTTYSQSFNVAKSNGDTAMLEKFTEGRSGSFFYFTHDSRYIVKTVTDGETTLLNQCVRDYFFYLHSNPDSLLTRFFGLHAMRLSPEQKFISLAVMENIFPTADYLRPTERYDLKGSWVARRTRKGKNLNVPISKLTLKDNDLNRKIRIGPEVKARLLAQLKRDVGFLASIGIMDYSLLIGIRDFENDPRQELPLIESRNQSRQAASLSRHRHPSLSVGYVPPSPLSGDGSVSPGPSVRAMSSCPPTFTATPSAQDPAADCTPWHRAFYGGLLSVPPETGTLGDASSVTESALHELGPVPNHGDLAPEEKVWSIYYMGLIDILQRYNLSKKIEHFLKVHVTRLDAHGISAVNVNEYAERFIQAMDRIFE